MEMEIKKLIEKIKEFEPEMFFKWINIMSIHPSNQPKLIRFELILSAFFKIKEDEFLKQKKCRNDILAFINEMSDVFEKMFCMVEDYTPFHQNKLIPLFINGKSYYFFYGLIENPYTRINVLSKIIDETESDNYSMLDELKSDFFKSLEIQTKILSELTTDSESNEESLDIFVPSQAYFDKFSTLLSASNKQSERCCNLGCIELDDEKLIDECFNFRTPYLFKKPFASINNNSYIILPHFHIEYFGYFFKNIVNKESECQNIWDKTHFQFQTRVDKLCSKFFTVNSKIYAILANKESSINLLEKYDIASCFLVDQNKLLLFKTVKHSENKNFKSTNEVIKLAQQELSDFNKEVVENEEIGFGQYKYNHFFGIRTKDLEIWNILIKENISFEMEGIFLDKDGTNKHFVEIGDLAFVFDKFFEFRNDAPMHFVKFLQNDRDLLDSPNRMLTTNYTDRIAMYMSGDNYYFKFGKSPDFLNIVPYQGNEYESEYYFKKYQKTVYKTVERKFPNKFNVIESVENNTYRLVDTALMHVAYMVDIADYPIFIYPPMEISVLPETDNEFLVLMFPQLFTFYIDKFTKEFISILKSEHIHPSNYSILITSNKALSQKENRLPHLNPYADIAEDTPFCITTRRMQDGSVKTFIIANTNYVDSLINLFKPEDNSAEQYCIKALIKSIFEFSKNINAEQLASGFIEQHLPLSKKSFSFNLFYTDNPHLDKYSSPIKINASDIGKVNKLFAEYLAKKEIKPGEYTNDEAKEINGDIFDFLQNLLEKTIKKFNKDIVLYAYQQLELAEGKREMNSINYGMNTNRAIRYDLKEKVNDELQEVILQSAYSKQIIHTILKVNPNGDKAITKSDWTFLLGIVAALTETSQIYEYIHYDLSPHKMIISDLYEITTEKISDKVNHAKWQDEFVEHQIENSQYAYKKAVEEPTQIQNSQQDKEEKTIDNDLLFQQIDKLDSIFKIEYGYSLKISLDIIYALFRSNFNMSAYFPVFRVGVSDIKSYINEVFPEIEDNQIEKIVSNFSLSFSTYTKEDRLIPTELLRSRKRLNVSPIIQINDDEYIFGNQLCSFTHKLWWNDILEGDFPFKENNKKVSDALNEIHKVNSKALEEETSKFLKTILGNDYVILNLKKFNIISKDFPKNPPCGEIDILCINPDTKTIFILEAKSVLQQNRPYNINQIFKDFFGKKGKKYYVKLNKKYDFVNDNVTQFVEYFKLKYDSNWKVKKAFIVDKRLFAAYHTEYDVDFLQMDELEKYINE